MSRQSFAIFVNRACGLARKENHNDGTATGIGGYGPSGHLEVTGPLVLGLCPWPSDWGRSTT